MFIKIDFHLELESARPLKTEKDFSVLGYIRRSEISLINIKNQSFLDLLG